MDNNSEYVLFMLNLQIISILSILFTAVYRTGGVPIFHFKVLTLVIPIKCQMRVLSSQCAEYLRN